MRYNYQKLRIAIVGLLMALPLLSVTQAVAQEQEFTPEAYTSELSGYAIEVSGPEYEITSAELEHYANGDGEIVTIESELASVEISFFDDEDSPDGSIDAYLAGLENAQVEYQIVDRGESGEQTFAIVLIDFEGIEVLYYMQVTEDVTGNVDLFETMLSPVGAFEADIATAQEEITVDGAPFMEQTDGASLVAAVAEGGSETVQSTPVLASPEASLTFEIAGVDLGISGDFEVQGGPLIEGQVHAYALLGPDTFNMVAVGETGMTPEETVESFAGSLDNNYDTIELIDSADEVDSAWALYRVEQSGEPLVLLVWVDAVIVPGYETLVAIEMPESDVAGSIEAVQNNLTVDGQPLLASINADDMAELAGSEGVDPVDSGDASPEATEESGRESENPRDGAKLPGTDGSGNTSEVSSTPEATEEPVGQSESSWEGPLFGHVIEWDAATWTTDLEDTDIVISDEVEQLESIGLSAEFTAGPTFLYVDVYGESTATPQEYLAYWSSDEYLKRETSSGAEWTGELISSRSRDGKVAVVIRYTSGSDEFMLVRETVALEEGGIMLVTLDAPSADVAAAYTATEADVTVDTSPAFTVFSVGQIERLTGE